MRTTRWIMTMAAAMGTCMLWGCTVGTEPKPPAIEGYLPTTASSFAKASEDTKEGKPLTLEACVRIALAENPLNAAARAGVTSAREGVGEAEAPYYPQAGLNAGYRRWKTHAFLPSGLLNLAPAGMTIPTEVGPVNDYTINVNGSYVIFDSGERRAQLMAAKAKLGVAKAEAASIRQDIVLNVHEAYYSHTAALSALEVAQKNLERAQDHQRLAEKRKEIGVAVEADVLRAKVSTSNAKLALSEADNLVRVTRGNLNTSMGLPVELAMEVSREPGAIESPAGIDLHEALAKAIHSRSELAGAMLRIAGARSAVNAAKSAYGPTVTAQGQYGRRDEKFFPSDDDWAIGVGVEWPLFTGFYREHAVAMAKSELSKEEAQARQRVLEVRREVWQAHSELSKAYEGVETAKVLVGDAQESMKLTQNRYEEGTNTVTDLLDAQTALARAEGTQVRANWDYFLSKARFERATGALTAGEKN